MSSTVDNQPCSNSNVDPKANLHPALQSRITQIQTSNKNNNQNNQKYVLYLPTVNLRIDQNPAFAAACHLANHHHLPLVTLAILLDDASHKPQHSNTTQSQSQSQTPTILQTWRRRTFLLQAIQSASNHWSSHGSAVLIRIHSPGHRTPHHLTLARQARAVVTDEPFVDPYLSYVQSIHNACRIAGVSCWTVDGSTTVPPRFVLRDKRSVEDRAWKWQRRTEGLRMEQIRAAVVDCAFDPPTLRFVVRDHAFFVSPSSSSQLESTVQSSESTLQSIESSQSQSIEPLQFTESLVTVVGREYFQNVFPKAWQSIETPAPGVRPWTVTELSHLVLFSSSSSSPSFPSTHTSKQHDTTNTHFNTSTHSNTSTNHATSMTIDEWVKSWPGTDTSVPPCPQTIGTTEAGMARWNDWLRGRKGLLYYAKRRNDPKQPHAPSRMSAYLNHGIVSIFRIVHEIKLAQQQQQKQPKSKHTLCGADKFEQEIVKWREMSYAHTIARTGMDYDQVTCLPPWALRYLQTGSNAKRMDCESSTTHHNFQSTSLNLSLDALQTGNTGDATWDAMQQYLVRTGELHNNARMTWGKTLVHWGRTHDSFGLGSDGLDWNKGVEVDGHHRASRILSVLCYLNDRYALDGLSPPSYSGLLWCMGWCDKPDRYGGISAKPAHRYRVSAEGFRQAEQTLMVRPDGLESGSGGVGVGCNGRITHQTSILHSLKQSQPCRGEKRGRGGGGGGGESDNMSSLSFSQSGGSTSGAAAAVTAGGGDGEIMEQPSQKPKRNTLDQYFSTKPAKNDDSSKVVG